MQKVRTHITSSSISHKQTMYALTETWLPHNRQRKASATGEAVAVPLVLNLIRTITFYPWYHHWVTHCSIYSPFVLLRIYMPPPRHGELPSILLPSPSGGLAVSQG